MRMISARNVMGAGLAVLLAVAGAWDVAAQSWKPEKPVEVVIGTSPGGPQDRTGRTIQRILQDQKLVPTPVNVVNKAGGGGAIGLTYLNQHPGDGHYLMVNSLTLITNHLTGKTTMAYTDFTPLAVVGVEYVGAFVLADSAVSSGKDLVDRLGKDPSSLSISIGTTFGNATHLSFARAMKAAGVDIRRLRTVVFNSGADAMTALLGGHVQIMSSAPSTLLQHVKSGKVRALAIGAPKRLAGNLAGIPTWKELGVDSTFELWRGLLGPKAMSRAQIQFWDDALGRLVTTPAWTQQLARFDMEDVYRNSTETARYWKAEHDEVKVVLSDLGLVK